MGTCTDCGCNSGHAEVDHEGLCLECREKASTNIPKAEKNLLTHIKAAEKQLNDAIQQYYELSSNHFVEVEIEHFQYVGHPKPFIQIRTLVAKQLIIDDETKKCKRCNGEGQIYPDGPKFPRDCPECGGTGTKEES